MCQDSGNRHLTKFHNPAAWAEYGLSPPRPHEALDLSFVQKRERGVDPVPGPRDPKLVLYLRSVHGLFVSRTGRFVERFLYVSVGSKGNQKTSFPGDP